jgi:hypothetical protein
VAKEFQGVNTMQPPLSCNQKYKIDNQQEQNTSSHNSNMAFSDTPHRKWTIGMRIEGAIAFSLGFT